MVDSLEKAHPGKFSYKYALQALPNRIFSMKVSQAVVYVCQQKGDAEALKLLRHFLDVYKTWSEEALLNTPISTLMDNLAKETSVLTGLSETDLRK